MRYAIALLAGLVLVAGLLRGLGLLGDSPEEAEVEQEPAAEDEWAASFEPPAPPDRARPPARIDVRELVEVAAALSNAGDYYGALGALTTAFGERPDEPRYCYLLALVYYRLNLIRDAVEFVSCLERAPRELYPRVRAFLDQLRRSEEYEYEFELAGSEHFMASFPAHGTSAEAIGEVLDLLERARRSIEARSGLASLRPISVVVYDDNFVEATNTPDWGAGCYDGKIRISVMGLDENPERFQQTLEHEYVHAVLRQSAGLRIPSWLNEGIADYLDGTTYEFDDLLDQLDAADRLLDLPTLSRSFRDLPPERVRLAYYQSYWMTRNLIDESGWGLIDALLRDLQRDPQARFEERFAFHFGEMPQAYLERWYDEAL